MIGIGYIAVILVCLGVIIVAILIATKVIKIGHKNTSSSARSSNLPRTKRPYINPKTFDVGLMNMKKYQSSNLCDNSVLYPLNMIDVKYGTPPVSSECPCTQFIQAP